MGTPICGGLLQMLLLRLEKVNRDNFFCKIGISHAWVGHTCTTQGKKLGKNTKKIIFLPPGWVWPDLLCNESGLAWFVAQHIRPGGARGLIQRVEGRGHLPFSSTPADENEAILEPHQCSVILAPTSLGLRRQSTLISLNNLNLCINLWIVLKFGRYRT